MGLSIKYLSGLTPLNCETSKDGPVNPPTPDWTYLCANHADFTKRCEELDLTVFYAYQSSERFNVGSYSFYSRVREELARLAGWKSPQQAWEASGGLLWELINFSDCEGTIGPSVSAKLAKDFADLQPKADAHESEDFRIIFSDFRKAFETAANGGAVIFC